MAGLAGVPQKVLAHARERLRELENNAVTQNNKRPQRQLSLFPAEPEHAVIAMLAKLQPDNLTPKQALDALYKLKATIKS